MYILRKPCEKWFHVKEDLTTIPCKCGGIAKEVIHAELNIRRGWYCPCGIFVAAIGRERIVEGDRSKHGIYRS